MAKRTDFTQKMLGDLRRRKEHMSMTQNSKGSNQISADKYRNFKHPSQGSREINLRENIGSTSQYMNKWCGKGHNKSFSIEESSKEMVPVGRAHTSENIADLSMALAFAVKNSGKYSKLGSSGNPMSSFLQQVGRSVDFVEMDRSRLILHSNGQFPTLSHLHIKEISKGAQKLNQILNACYNGNSFDKYSVEMGQELLKVAMDLEESLRMLVNLQEASDYRVRPQRKQRVRLIEVDDNNEEPIEVDKQKKFDPPIFSFDRPSKNSLEDVRNVTKTRLLKQRQIALSSPAEALPINSEQAPTSSNVGSHRRSVSCGSVSSTIATLSNAKKNSKTDPRPEKGRIPNVIAKLMGLEELPALAESQIGALNDVRQGTSAGKDSKKILQESRKKVEPVITKSEKLSSQSARQKAVRTNNLEFSDTQNRTLEMVVHEEKPHLDENILKQEKKRLDKPKPKEQKSTGRGVTKERLFESDQQRMVPQTRKYPEVSQTKQDKTATKETTLKKEKRNANDSLLMVSTQQKPQQDRPCQPRYTLGKFESQDVKLQAIEKEQLNVKNKLHKRKPNGAEKIMLKRNSSSAHDVMNVRKKPPNTNHAMLSKNTKEAVDAMPAKALKSSHHENLISQGNTNLNLNKKKSLKENLEKHSRAPTDTETDGGEVAAPTTKLVITKPVHISCLQNKVDNTEASKSVVPKIMEEELSRKTDSFDKYAKPLKQETSVMQETKQTRHERNYTEVSISLSKKAELIMQLDLAQATQKIVELTPTLCNSITEDHQRKEPEPISSDNNIQKVTTEVSDSLQASTIVHRGDQEFKFSDISIQIKDPDEKNKMDVSKFLQQEQQKSSKSVIPRSLTENEIHLMHILIKSQLFLNAAEALFKLQIPVSILQASAQNCQDEDSKILLDCGYEVMKRKGRRKELTFYPFASISIRSKKVKCLEDLVKELHGDLETLKISDENGDSEYDAAKCFHKMLQRDIYNGNPDVNSMWDFGWSDMMFACIEEEEVIRDVEKHMLNGLLNEITMDFLHINKVI